MKTTNSLQRIGLGLTACGLLTQTASALVTIDFVTVGNAGNATDPTTGFGAVAYDYAIGKYEVTLNQYTEFLNAVAATDTYGLYNTSMSTVLSTAGIARSGSSGSYSYSVIGSGNCPVTYVSWYDSARFVNWLHNGQPLGLQAAGTTETGAYTLTGNSGLITRNSGWAYSLPSENEWYKAAYHQPMGLGGDVDNYWLYPAAHNAIPNGSPSDYAAMYSLSHLTDVGTFSLAGSFYGTFDQGGNVWERNDAVRWSQEDRGLRGGAWGLEQFWMIAQERGFVFPADEYASVGFRVAIVPEPNLAGLVGLGALLLVWKRR